jgi:hypothetical protein
MDGITSGFFLAVSFRVCHRSVGLFVDWLAN